MTNIVIPLDAFAYGRRRGLNPQRQAAGMTEETRAIAAWEQIAQGCERALAELNQSDDDYERVWTCLRHASANAERSLLRRV
jgi:hypothetical protein